LKFISKSSLWFKKHLLRKKLYDVTNVEIDRAKGEGSLPILDSFPETAPQVTTHYVPKPGHQATRQDVSKFMKHGQQIPYYRKSVKAKVKPEEED